MLLLVSFSKKSEVIFILFIFTLQKFIEVLIAESYYWWKTLSEQFCNGETVFIFIFLLVLPENRKVDSVESLSWQDIYVDLSVNRVDIVLTVFSLFSFTESLLKLVFWSSKDRMCVKKQMHLYCFKNSWLTQTNLRTDWNFHQKVLTWVLAGKEDTSAHQLKKKN